GDTLAIGAFTDDNINGADAGAVYLFHRVGGAWQFQTKLLAGNGAAGDRFGFGVVMEGATLVVNSIDDDSRGVSSGAVYTFERDVSGDWVQAQKLTASNGAAGDQFGYTLALQGNRLVAAAVVSDRHGA